MTTLAVLLVRLLASRLPGGRRPTLRSRPRLEGLEERLTPSTYHVNSLTDVGAGSGMSGDLRYCITGANQNPGPDVIVFDVRGTITLSSPLPAVSDDLDFQGPGAGELTVSGNHLYRVFAVNAGVTTSFDGLTIADGHAPADSPGGMANGGGILSRGPLTVTDCVVAGNEAGNAGGGVYNVGTLVVQGSTVRGNSTNGGYPDGGGVFSSGTATISDSFFSDNHAGSLGSFSGGGGALYSDFYSTMTVRNCTLSGNIAGSGAGAIITNYGTLTVTGCTLSGNETAGNGGAIIVSVSTAVISDSRLVGNTTGIFGGGAIIASGQLTLSGCVLADNVSEASGGAISSMASLTIRDCTLSGNRTGNAGGAIWGGAVIQDSRLLDNIAGTSGGAISGYHNDLSDCLLSGNHAVDGAALYNSGPSTVRGCTLSGNVATGSGGGIFNARVSGNLTVTDTALVGNSAGLAGGAIANVADASGWPTLTVTGSTLAGNTAPTGAGLYNHGALVASNSTLSGNSATGTGGGLWNDGAVLATNLTITANRAVQGGGGLFVAAGLPYLRNTLVAGNFGSFYVPHDDISGPLCPFSDSNLVGDGTGMTGITDGVNGNQVGSRYNPIDPRLGPLADNGGPTWTHALLEDSPAIDAGNNDYATEWDQRGPGFARVAGGRIDISAFEFQGGMAPAAGGPGSGGASGTAGVRLLAGLDLTPDRVRWLAARERGVEA
jgi:hypothetical protein